MAHVTAHPEKSSVTARRCFVVRQNERGDWCACRQGEGIEHAFATQREAIHFALYETGTRCAAVSLTPPRQR
jgi:hypothetical protein